jgi:hypothetical protein
VSIALGETGSTIYATPVQSPIESIEVTMSTSSTRNESLSGKIYDPVFLCMVGAVVLAVGTSIGLRVMIAGAGPAAARADVPSLQDNNAYVPSTRIPPATDHSR